MKRNELYYYIPVTITGILLLIGCMVYTFWLQDIIRLPECVIYTSTGWYCPACGGTRAVMSLLEGRLSESIAYHPVVLYAVVVWCFYVGTNTVILLATRKRERMVPLTGRYGLIGIMLLVFHFIMKNI